MLIELLAPPLAIWAALVASIAMPFLLIGYAHGPFSRLSLGQRFWAAMGTAVALWVVMIVWIAADTTRSAHAEMMFDLIAGAAVLLTAGLVVYSFWALASFGFTILMLVCLAKKGKPLSLDAWADAYGHEHSMRAFTQDRITVLVGMGLAEEHEGRIRLTGSFAASFARFVYFVARVFAVAIEK